MSNIEQLRAALHGNPPGEINDTSSIERMLFKCWHELKVTGEDGGLQPFKLLNRTEELSWHPPFVEFDIERHGATVSGSVYAEVHHWKVNLDAAEASVEKTKRRQVGPKDKRLEVKPLAQEIARLIQSHKPDAQLRWKTDGIVRLQIETIIPATNHQTTSSRRRRFKAALEIELAPHGWKRTGVNTFSIGKS